MNALKNALDNVLKWASVVLFAILVVIVVWQVVSRSLNMASSWSEEAARYTFVWLGFFASALVFSEKGHIAVDFLVRKLPDDGRRVTGIISQLAIIALAGFVLIWGGIRVSAGAWNQQLSSLPTQVGVMYTVMPITGVLIIFYALHHIAAIIGGEDPYADEDEKAEGLEMDTVSRGEENL